MTIDFGCSNIGEGGAKRIAELLKSMPSLQKLGLDVGCGQICENGGKAITE